MTIKVMQCCECRVAIEANYPDTCLGQLSTEHQRFIEMFVLASGSLKEIASQMGVSYPTVRSRLDRIIDELQERMSEAAVVSESAPSKSIRAVTRNLAPKS